MSRIGHDTLKTRRNLTVNGKDYAYYSLKAVEDKLGDLSRLPFSLKVLLENLLRYEDGRSVTTDDISAFADWLKNKKVSHEIAYRPARVLLQDFTGVPAVVDLAAMRDGIVKLGGDADKINPLSAVDLVIDHSVMVDEFGTVQAFQENVEREFERNGERYEFLKWGQQAFDNFRVVPPGTGICHQVNLEYLGQTVWTSQDESGAEIAYPDTLVGTDSHTTMINGLGVLGWGVGGIEAEAAMLGQPVSMLIPEVVGFKLSGKLKEGATATDLVLTVTQMLRAKGVVGKFVEFYGDGLNHMSLADRATISNMAPEYGATCGFFPVDDETCRYLEFTGREADRVALVREYSKAQGLWRDENTPDPVFTDTLELDMASVEPSIAGPKRPQDKILLSNAAKAFVEVLEKDKSYGDPAKTLLKDPVGEEGKLMSEAGQISETDMDARLEAKAENASPYNRCRGEGVAVEGADYKIGHGDVVIAAITSCTNTSNPSVMIASGLVARNAHAKGMTVKPWVKTSLAPGSQVVTDYLEKAGLQDDLDALGFNLVGYGCTTCIGNSGPLPKPIADAVQKGDLNVTSVLSGNRNFEGRINPHVKSNYLASPPLVVAYALAGSMLIDVYKDSLGKDADGNDVYLKDIWPSNDEIRREVEKALTPEMFTTRYADVFKGPEEWQAVENAVGKTYAWSNASTYIQNPPFFDGMTMDIDKGEDIKGAKLLAILGDSTTTDHISPAGAIKQDSPAGEYLLSRQVPVREFNSYGSRRGNHEVMMRGTFANIRIKNLMLDNVEGGFTRYLPTGEEMPIYDAAMKYQADGTPLVVIAGKEYGTGSSRDWAAKGTRLLGVKAVIAESFERIHRSNLIGMGVLPLQFNDGDGYASLGLKGDETYDLQGIEGGLSPRQSVDMTITYTNGESKTVSLTARLDTADEVDYYTHGGILHYVLRDMARG
jgi:aconitate hydratase